MARPWDGPCIGAGFVVKVPGNGQDRPQPGATPRMKRVKAARLQRVLNFGDLVTVGADVARKLAKERLLGAIEIEVHSLHLNNRAFLLPTTTFGNQFAQARE